MKKFAKIVSLGLTVALLSQPVFGQGFAEDFQRLASDNAKSYIQPLITGLGTGLNSGVYRTADIHGLLGFDVHLNISPVAIPDEATTYEFKLPTADVTVPITINNNTYDITMSPDQIYSEDREAATLFGDSEGSEITVNENVAYGIIETALRDRGVPQSEIDNREGQIRNAIQNNVQAIPMVGGLGVQTAGALSAQASVGLPFGVEAQLRYIPTSELGDFGEFGLMGFGARLDVDQFIPIPFFPVDIAAGAFFQNITVGPVDISSSIFHAEVSKSIPFITVYGGVGVESSTLTADYTIEDTGNDLLDGTNVAFDLEGENSFRTTVGARLKLFIISINADYSTGEYNSANLGLGITFR